MADTSSSPTVLALNNAGVELSGRVIWNGVDLSIHKGEFVAILGPNGAGKSTLLRAILGMQSLSTGNITVNGRVGYLPQRRSFDASLPIRGVDLVRLGLDGHKWGWPIPLVNKMFQRESERARDAKVAEAIHSVGASEYAQRPIGRTSGGEQQRLLIAQALMRNPELLLLDEPLDSLDIPNQHSVSSLIKSLSTERDITVLMVAHDVNPILPYVDRVVYVANQHVLSGTPEEVIQTETLTRLYGSPVEVLKTADGRLVVVGAPDQIHSHAHVSR